MVVRKRDAHLALDQLVEYRNHLDNRIDGSLISALNRLMNVFQSRLFLALLDIQDFYESTLLDPNKNNDEKTAAALDVALRWENISSPSLVASTIDLRRSNSSNNLTSFDRARSLYQINVAGEWDGEPLNFFTSIPHRTNMTKLQRERQQRNQSNSTLSFSMPNYSPSIHSPYKWTDHNPQAMGDPNHRSVNAYSTEYGVYDNVRVPTPDRLMPARPVVKPRQRRLRKTKPASASSNVNRSQERIWNVDEDSSKSSQSNRIIVDQSNTELLLDEDVNRQWGLLSHLPITTEVIINKTKDGFGFSIAGGRSLAQDGTTDLSSDIFVTRINPDGAASRDGGLQVGDRLISVNGISLIGVSHEEAVRALQLAGSRLKLVVERRNPQSISEGSSSLSLPPVPAINKISVEPSIPVATSPGAHASGSGASIGSAGAMSMSSAGLTNTSLVSGSLFDPGPSKQTFSPAASQSTGKGRPATSESGGAQSEPPTHWPQTEKPDEGAHTKRQSSLDMGYMNQLDCKLFSGMTKAATVDRKSRKNFIPTNFPAFSWCTGLQKPIGCAAMLGGHRSLPGSSASSRRTPTGSTESRGKHQLTPGGFHVNSRPVPLPQPGPLVIDVTLLRGTRSGLGFSIAGGVGNETVDGDPGIFVTKLTPGGVAETDGRISVGDRIVQVNETSLVEVTHEQAVRALRQAGDHVHLILVKRTVHPSRLVWSTDYDEQGSVHPEGSGPISPNAKSTEKNPSPKLDDAMRVPADLCSPRSSPLNASQTDYDRVTGEESANSPYFSPTGQEFLEAQMSGLIDYTAAASVGDLVSKWPKARLVTLHRTGRYNTVSQEPNEKKKHRRSRSVGGSLGLNIVGGDGSEATFVSQVQPDKPAGLCKRIFVGDRLLAVNGIDVSEHGHEQAAAALRSAPDRVDLVLVYCPEEYAEFERYYSRQLKAVGHKMSSKTAKQLATEISPQAKQDNRSSTKHHRTPKPSAAAASELASPAVPTTLAFEGNELFIRCQVDYDPSKESHQAVPKKAFSLRSGDLLCVLNWTDPEWWEAQRIDPMSSEVAGPIGLVPSRQRLERRERTRTRHVNFLARAGRSSEPGSLEHSRSSGHIEGGVTHRRDHSLGMAVSVTSLASTGAKHADRRGRSGSNATHDKFVLSYITVTPVQLSFARPVVVLGHMKDRIADELLCEFPDRFGTAVPYTTRACRSNEVEGRDYHFVVSREIMVADIAAQRYLEAGEYNGNLYGTHLESVFEVAELGLHCLLDVGGPALRRLEAAGLPPIAILVLPETFSSQPTPTSTKSADSTAPIPNTGDAKSTESHAIHNAQIKLARLIRHFSNYLTAILTTDDFDVAYNRVKELIFENSGSLVWLNSPQPLP